MYLLGILILVAVLMAVWLYKKKTETYCAGAPFNQCSAASCAVRCDINSNVAKSGGWSRYGGGDWTRFFGTRDEPRGGEGRYGTWAQGAPQNDLVLRDGEPIDVSMFNLQHTPDRLLDLYTEDYPLSRREIKLLYKPVPEGARELPLVVLFLTIAKEKMAEAAPYTFVRQIVGDDAPDSFPRLYKRDGNGPMVQYHGANNYGALLDWIQA